MPTERHRRIEIRPTGTNGDRSCRALLFDDDGAELCELPARYVGRGTEEEPRYVVLDLAPTAPPLWGGG